MKDYRYIKPVTIVAVIVFAALGFAFGYKNGVNGQHTQLQTWGHPYQLQVVGLGKPMVNTDPGTGETVAQRSNDVHLVSTDNIIRNVNANYLMAADRTVGYTESVMYNRYTGEIVPTKDFVRPPFGPWLDAVLFSFLAAVLGGLVTFVLLDWRRPISDEERAYRLAN